MSSNLPGKFPVKCSVALFSISFVWKKSTILQYTINLASVASFKLFHGHAQKPAVLAKG